MDAQAQSPDELVDILDADGRPTGQTKRRAEVHRDGDWHRSVHIWVWGIDDDGPFLLLNQRSRAKDVGPGALDPTVGGHLGAGETVQDAFREVEEEIGITLEPKAIVYLWCRQRDSASWFPGIRDRELQEVHIARDDRPLRGYHPNTAELEGLVKLPLAEALALFEHRIEAATGIVLHPGGDISPFRATVDQLLVRGDNPYFVDVAREISRRAAAEFPAPDRR